MHLTSLWFVIPHLITIRIETIAVGLAIVIGVTLRTRNFILAMATMLTWLIAFETLWQAGYGFFGYTRMHPAFQITMTMLGWLLLFTFALRIRPERRMTILWLAIMVIWMAIGFHANYPGQRINVLDEILNEAGKTVLGFGYLLGALRRPRDLGPALLAPSPADSTAGIPAAATTQAAHSSEVTTNPSVAQ